MGCSSMVNVSGWERYPLYDAESVFRKKQNTKHKDRNTTNDSGKSMAWAPMFRMLCSLFRRLLCETIVFSVWVMSSLRQYSTGALATALLPLLPISFMSETFYLECPFFYLPTYYVSWL
ncbi:hypothetical protein RB195_026015 [Necator americanus]|uniref:Uncharacterized protein n=1 Tax=Necator americanus TaxID=51031 RepID=A0ABR1EX84_NECAM